jgi:hypothetical protein
MELTPSGGVPDYEVFMGGRHLATYSNNSTYFPHTAQIKDEPAGELKSRSARLSSAIESYSR